jgi:hypothetical protein
MPWLADTNILLRLTNIDDPEHVLVAGAVAGLLQRGEQLHYTQQNRREFWNVCTRPAGVNGFGYTVDLTRQALGEVDAIFHRLADRPESGPEWDRLVVQHQVMGRAVHDAQLILTLNVADFRRYPEITPIHPSDVIPLQPVDGGEQE